MNNNFDDVRITAYLRREPFVRNFSFLLIFGRMLVVRAP